jgi:hypothetical protein
MVERSETPTPEERRVAATLSQWRAPSWVVPLFGLAAVGVVLWLVFLVSVLPSTQRVDHWDVAWGGFDAVLAFLLISVAVSAWRRSPRLQGAATAAAILLFVDAWFDVLTSKVGSDRWVAIAQAALLEVPLALLCLLVARNTERSFLRPVLNVVDHLADAPLQPDVAGADNSEPASRGR